ncbi:riboflavin synthase subunit alpha [Candidatus Erwinia haradaeae]|uniref:Riboflavin synthase n=1 Tax=Candidatus Erwinia haradaeae TaxID=1922217 RepID=A0A451DAN5_9GAMM|nr:riboflavin synthase subunit alpha [Candidatus Erwinia haradaeae]VFP83379.1 Riboflavin synthase [Candidatus Erwinia haradaeae]
MFTGIVQGIAELCRIQENKQGRTHVMRMPKILLLGIEIGASVSNNGCCLTVTDITDAYVSFDLIEETLALTTLGSLSEGDQVNVERAAKFSDEIGGHIVSGHITTTATISKIYNDDTYHNCTIWLKLSQQNYNKYIFYKGFITIDGISLTIGEIVHDTFCVHLIPETLLRTTISRKDINSQVNIEIDLHTQILVDTAERVLGNHKKQLC